MKFLGLELFLKRKKMFLERVIIQEGCWDWSGNINPDGYARFKMNNKQMQAHVFSWLLYKGEIPYKQIVCHKCDNRKCCNPDHLFLGYSKDNSKDMKDKDRQAKGSKHIHAKLTEKDVLAIKIRLNNGETSYRIAKDYPVNMSTIYGIQYKKQWKHITLEENI